MASRIGALAISKTVRVEAVAQAIAEFLEWGVRGFLDRRDLRKASA